MAPVERIGWNESRFCSISRPFTTLNGSFLPVAFSISSTSLQITRGTSFPAISEPRCLPFFPFPFPVSGICGEAHLFHMALGATISSISMTSFITREASDAQHFSLELEQSPGCSLWPVLTHAHRFPSTHTSKQASEVGLMQLKTNSGLEVKYRQKRPLLARLNWTVAVPLPWPSEVSDALTQEGPDCNS